MRNQSTRNREWRCGKCGGFDFPLHSPRCPLRQSTDAGKDREAWKLTRNVMAMLFVSSSTVLQDVVDAIAQALAQAREEGRREEREACAKDCETRRRCIACAVAIRLRQEDR
jgi:hypothetical protein